ncbi:MAG: hypothetical protein ACRENN_07835 [Candidatus Eiseniibacteriota bacterium]
MIRTWGRVLVLAGLLGTAGCHDDNNTIVAPDPPPYTVEGVRSVTGDGVVTITWRANQESDIDYYKIYRNFAPTGTFTLIGTTSDTRYEDRNVVNGTTYYYALAAVDHAGQESVDLSFENVFDTPRPEGTDVTLSNDVADSTVSGWDFSSFARRPSTDSRTDMYYAASGGHYLVYVPVDTRIQDSGFIDLVDVDYAPPSGWSADGVVEAIPGHSYIVLTRDNHYAKFAVVMRDDTGMNMDWAYQVAVDNPELVRPHP